MQRVKDTADDARQRPDADAQSRPEHGFAVDVRLHEVRQQRLDEDVERADAERQHGAHQVHREQSGFLGKTCHTPFGTKIQCDKHFNLNERRLMLLFRLTRTFKCRQCDRLTAN